jgi:hypothetical protein
MSDVVIYNDGELELNISVNEDTIWLTQKQIAELFDVKVPAISKHIKNIFMQNELIENMVVSKMEITTQHGAIDDKSQTKTVNIYSLDIILAVGYRTNSLKAIHFRQWATSVLKSYIQEGYAINSDKITNDRFVSLENKVELLGSKLNILESKDLKPSHGIFYDGEMFDAYTFVSDIIRDAKSSVVLIDNYIDDTTLTLFSKNQNIKVTIYTHTFSKQLKLDLDKYNSQYKDITIKTFKNSHDRFMIIDDINVYHIGASLKDLGNKWFAFSKIGLDVGEILEKLK